MIGGDLVGTQLVETPLETKSAAGMTFQVHPSQQFVAAGAKSFSISQVTATPGNVFTTGAQASYNITPSSILPDHLSQFGCILQLQLINNDAAPITIGTYGHLLFRQYLIRYTSSINQTYTAEACLAAVLSNLSSTQLQQSAALMGINAATGAVLPVVIAPGATFTYYLPLLTPFNNRAAYIRALQSIIEVNIQFNTAANLVTVGVPGGLALVQQNIIWNGWKWGERASAIVARRYLSGPVVTRQIVPTALTVAIPAGITNGQNYQIDLSGSTGLVTALQFFVRSNTGLPTVAFTPIANSVAAVTLRADSQPVSWLPNQVDSAFYRAFFAGVNQLTGSSLAQLGVTSIPFSSDLSETLSAGMLLGSYFVSQASNLQVLSAVTNANVEALVLFWKVQNVLQAGSEMSIRIL